MLLNSFQSHFVAPTNSYFNCDPTQQPPPLPPPPSYHENYGIASAQHNFHSQSLTHYHPHSYHNSIPSTGLNYDIEHNQSYYMPTTTIDSYNQLTNNNSIGIKSNESNGYYGANGGFSYGCVSQVPLPPPNIHNHIKTEIESNHSQSQQLNSSSEISGSPAESSNHSHCEYTPNHIDFNQNTNQVNGSQSPIGSNAQTKFSSKSICNVNNSSKFCQMNGFVVLRSIDVKAHTLVVLVDLKMRFHEYEISVICRCFAKI